MLLSFILRVFYFLSLACVIEIFFWFILFEVLFLLILMIFIFVLIFLGWYLILWIFCIMLVFVLDILVCTVPFRQRPRTFYFWWTLRCYGDDLMNLVPYSTVLAITSKEITMLWLISLFNILLPKSCYGNKVIENLFKRLSGLSSIFV